MSWTSLNYIKAKKLDYSFPLSHCCCSVGASIPQARMETSESLLFACSVLDCLRAFPNPLFLQHWITPHYDPDSIDKQGGRGRTPQAYTASSGPLLSPLTCPFGFCNTRVWILALPFAPAAHRTALLAFPYPLRGQINPIITLLVIPFTPHAFWRPFPMASVHFSRSVTRAGPCLALYILTVQLK